ncbi:WecB/TagA/CpsF family glycosyltransferase [Luteolibacter marinus]|uniref:WecB/TagA/CpsF family glycosyltransferase n=1 Tax=Luteolibacter marinus TaxID=2776705 RepID=UPI0018665D4C|nr:WecB/TagA/CpsF family glycosyltransferase [Luteolibacter marinus]
MEAPEKTIVLNTPCVLTDKKRLTASLAEACRSRAGSALSVDFTNVHIVAMRTVDEGFHRSTSNVDWFVSDSQVLTWAISSLGAEAHERVYGPEFLDYFVRNGDAALTHYFLGASQECLDLLLRRLSEIRPELKVVGSRNGYFSPADEEAILASINAAKPDILWIGLGTPKQQEWISRFKDRLDAGAVLAVGFAFDVNAGTKKDAPKWMGPLGLTWLYRLACEPRRLWQRYFYYNSVFLAKLLRQLATGRPTGSPAAD